MEQHRLNSLTIICIERTYGSQVIVNSTDKMIDIFGQRHGRKNFFFQYVSDDIETVDRIKFANFRLSYFSNDSGFISWENGERLCLHPDFNHHPFSSKKVTAPKSEGAHTPMSNSDLYKHQYIHRGILKLLMPTNYVQIFYGLFDGLFDRQKTMDFKRYLLLLHHLAMDRANNHLSLSPLGWTEAKSPYSSRE